MRKLLLRSGLSVALFISSISGFGQQEQLLKRMRSFHELLVKKESIIESYIDDNLSYGHSNGWIETKTEMIKNLETGYTSYKSIKEDSIKVTIKGNVAHTRFVGDYTVALNGGNYVTYRLKVLEVWVKRNKNWKIFARQAIR